MQLHAFHFQVDIERLKEEARVSASRLIEGLEGFVDVPCFDPNKHEACQQQYRKRYRELAQNDPLFSSTDPRTTNNDRSGWWIHASSQGLMPKAGKVNDPNQPDWA